MTVSLITLDAHATICPKVLPGQICCLHSKAVENNYLTKRLHITGLVDTAGTVCRSIRALLNRKLILLRKMR
jgi:hypothetical protein